MRKPFDGEFRLSQAFGMNPAMYTKFGYKGHNGMDWACPTGTYILAPHTGTVIEAALDADGYGNYLKIENDKEGSVLGHNKTLLVKVGDIVREGQRIAVSNNTGYSTGAHCHWGYYTKPRDRANGYGGFVDQAPLLVTQPEPTMTTEQENILNFLKEKNATEGMVREAFGALADIPNIKKKLEDLEKNQDSLLIIVDDLRLSIGEKAKDIATITRENKVLIKEKETFENQLAEYKKYKGWYETALETQVNKYTGSQLISMGLKKIWANRRLLKQQ